MCFLFDKYRKQKKFVFLSVFLVFISSFLFFGRVGEELRLCHFKVRLIMAQPVSSPGKGGEPTHVLIKGNICMVWTQQLYWKFTQKRIIVCKKIFRKTIVLFYCFLDNERDTCSIKGLYVQANESPLRHYKHS